MDTPLAYRMRPRTLEEFVGQEDIVGKGTALRRAIEEDMLSSIILAGPPGTGKTTLAQIIAERTKAEFVTVNAVLSGVKELRGVCSQAEKLFSCPLTPTLSLREREHTSSHTEGGQRTVLFIDEIHRFNRAQQDALLPYVERGVVILIGATTHNPYFEVNAALVSRSHVYLLQPLSVEYLVEVLERAVRDERGYGGRISVSKDALKHLATIANGDARIALNALELSVLTLGKRISLKEAEEVFKKCLLRHDKSGEDHYNTVSAFIKTMRGSDPDAALLWLFKMLASGEEPRFLFRRMTIFASEDVGNADPRALQIVVASWQAFEFVGLPEGEFFLAHACLYLSQAPKSNAIKIAKDRVKEAITKAPSLEVPNFLRNAPMKGMKEQGYGEGYQYPHDSPAGVVTAQYFPTGMNPIDFYEPTNRGFEEEVRERMERAKLVIRRRG